MANNQVYDYFQQMLDNYNVDENLFEIGVAYLFSLNPDNPYEPNSNEYKMFNKISNFCFTWKKGNVDSKVSYRRMIAFAKEFCEMVNENPFTWTPLVKEPIIEKVEEVIEESVIEQPQIAEKIINEKPETVLGVVPEEKKSFFKRNKKKEGAKK